MYGRTQVPLVLQAEANECGLACLCMVLGYHGAHLDLYQLRSQNGSYRPLSLTEMADIAQNYQMATRALRCEPEDLSQISLPAIVHFDFDHYVVLEECHANRVTLSDPARGKVTQSLAEFGEHFTGIVLETTPGADFVQLGRRRKFSPVELFAQLPFGEMKTILITLLVLTVLVQAFALITPFYLQIAIDEVLVSHTADLALVLTAGFAAVYCLSALAQWFRGLVALYLGNQLSYLLASGLMNRMLKLQRSFYERRTVGDVVSRFGSLGPLQNFVTDSAIRILLDSLMILTTFIVLLLYSTQAALFISAMVLAFSIAQYLLLMPFRRHSHEHIVADAKTQSHFIETIQTIGTIKRFEGSGKRQRDWLNLFSQSLAAQVRAGRIQVLFDILRYLLTGVCTLGLVYLSVDDIFATTLTIGMLYAMVAYANHLIGAVVSLTAEVQNYLMLPLHIQRLSDFTDASVDDRSKLDTAHTSLTLSLSRLTFQYPDHNEPIFRNINLELQPGHSIAISGPSGCGKSTLLRVIMGDLVATGGSITVGGRPIANNTNPDSWFSSVMAEDCLLDGTVTDNIAYLDAQPNPRRVIEAAQIACLHEEILHLPLGYQERIAETSSLLSSGQRQRLLIARAVYRNAPILMLDEGTCHLNRELEMQVMCNLLALSRICVFISHRPEISELASQTLTLNGFQLPQPATLRAE